MEMAKSTIQGGKVSRETYTPLKRPRTNRWTFLMSQSVHSFNPGPLQGKKVSTFPHLKHMGTVSSVDGMYFVKKFFFESLLYMDNENPCRKRGGRYEGA